MQVAWKKQARKEHRIKHEPPFVLKVSPGLPQSWLDKRIFNEKWELRRDWEKTPGRTNFVNTLNREEEFSRSDLAEIRGKDYRKCPDGRYIYAPHRNGSGKATPLY